MASELRVNTLKDAAGNNSIATSVVASGSAKAWVNFNGTSTVAIGASNNVASITDNGTGDYTANFTSAITDANYAVTLGFTPYTTTNFTTYGAIHGDATTGPTTKTTSAIRVEYKNLLSDTNFYDAAEINVVIHR